MLSIHGICKTFDGRPVLKNISFDFPEAAVTALRGPSGCGKTTLVNIILGLLAPDAGEVRLPANVRTAAVFQEDRLIEHFSAARNVRLTAPASVTDRQRQAALEMCIRDRRCGGKTGRIHDYRVREVRDLEPVSYTHLCELRWRQVYHQ